MGTLNNEYKTKLYQEEVARALQEMFRLGYFPYDGFGEVSVRDQDTGDIYISIEPGQFHIHTPEDYHGCDTAVVDREGHALTGHTAPSRALPLHLAIYRARPDVHAIVHTRSQWTSLFSSRGEGIPFMFEEQYDLMGVTRCVNSLPSVDESYYQEIIEALGGRRTVIMREFGVISVAGNVDRAVNYLAWVEAVARKASRAALIGKVNVVPHDDPNFRL